MKKEFKEPQLELVLMVEEDIIKTSGEDDFNDLWGNQ